MQQFFEGAWAHGPIANARTQHGNNTDNKNKNLGQACLPEVHGEIGKGVLPIQIHIRSRFGSSTPPSRAPPPRDPMSSDESEIPGRAVDQPDSIAEGTSLSSQGNIQIDKEIPPGQPAPATPASEADAHLHRVMDEAEDLQKEGQQDIEGMSKFEKELEQLFDDLKSTSTGPRSVASTLSDEDATKDEELERAHAAGLVKSNDVMGFRFTRAKKASLAMTLEYEQCTTASEKEKMRIKWMEGKYQKYSQEREKKTTSSTADLEWGTYEPFEVMCGNESATGVTATGVRAGFNIAKTCLEIGGKWVRRNNFSKRIEFLRPKAGYKDKFEKAWTVTVKEKKIEANPGEDNLPEGPKDTAKVKNEKEGQEDRCEEDGWRASSKEDRCDGHHTKESTARCPKKCGGVLLGRRHGRRIAQNGRLAIVLAMGAVAREQWTPQRGAQGVEGWGGEWQFRGGPHHEQRREILEGQVLEERLRSRSSKGRRDLGPTRGRGNPPSQHPQDHAGCAQQDVRTSMCAPRSEASMGISGRVVE